MSVFKTGLRDSRQNQQTFQNPMKNLNAMT